MNERIRELAKQADWWIPLGLPSDWNEGDYVVSPTQLEKFAELILRECSNLLFDESERLYAYSSECDNMRESDEAELVAEKCVDLITMIEQHFGVK